MKRVIITVFVIALSLSQTTYADGVGSMFGTLQTAQALGQGNGSFGLGIGLLDNITSFNGSYTYGLSQYTDGRIKIALVDPDVGDIKVALGVDFKWQFWNVGPNSKNPFDFALGGMFEYSDLGPLSVIEIGGLLLASYPVALSNSTILTPYGRFNARVEAVNFDNPRFNDDSNLEVGLNGGVKWQVTNTMSLFGEFQLDGNDGVFFGVDFLVM